MNLVTFVGRDIAESNMQRSSLMELTTLRLATFLPPNTQIYEKMKSIPLASDWSRLTVGADV